MFKKIISIALSIATLASLATITTTAETQEFTKNSYDFTQNLTVGFNIGNTFDSAINSPDETAWGCPKVKEGLIQSIKDKGFDTIRLPVTWCGAMSKDENGYFTGDFKDNNVYINRVKEVVDWIYDRDMYCIINTHHEMTWLRTWWAVKGTYDVEDVPRTEAMYKAFSKLWTNISNKFKDYGERLIFEGYNETRADETAWTSIDDDQVAITKIAQTYVDAVRATGGNNSRRYLMVSAYAAGLRKEVKKFKMPNDPANHLILSVHSYAPHSFCFPGSQKEFKQSDLDKEFDSDFQFLRKEYLSKGTGVILGEMGAGDKDNDDERVKYAHAIIAKCAEHGIIPVVWDNNKFYNPDENVEMFGLVHRNAPFEWYEDKVATAYVSKAKELRNSRPTAETFAAEASTTTTTTTTTKTSTTTTTTTQPTTFPTTTTTQKTTTTTITPTTNTTTTTTTQNTYQKGDVSRDGLINSFDIMLLKQALVDTQLQSGIMDVADVSEDNKLNSFDIMLIKKLILESK